MKISGNRIKSYSGILVNNKVNLSFNDVNLIVGPNGCGKTTLLNYIMGHDDKLKKIYVGCNDVDDDFITNIFQQYISGNKNKIKLVSDLLFKTIGVKLISGTEWTNGKGSILKLYQLSGGMRRVVSVILAMATDADVVLIDHIELHMHLQIQETIIKHMLLLNMRAQLFVTTYSPYIIADWQSEIIYIHL